jgi:uncharacterized protein (DUF2062 family)
MKDRLRKLIPTRESLRKISALRPVAHLLNRQELWHTNRRAVSGAVFVGLFSAFIPGPSQMLLAALIAIVTRGNLPISVALVWITNPITIPPMFYASYQLGALILDIDTNDFQVEITLDWLFENFMAISEPLLVGAIACGLISGSIGFTAAHFIWRNQVLRRWRKRCQTRAQRPPSSP